MKIGIKWYEKVKWKEFDMKIGIKINWFENWYENWYEKWYENLYENWCGNLFDVEIDVEVYMKIDMTIDMKISRYREFSPNANFISANFNFVVFQDIFCYCDSMNILLMQFLANAVVCAIYFDDAIIS